MSLASPERSAKASQTAVVILNYNGERLLKQFLPIVIQCSGRAKIVVADNASTDQSVAFIKSNFPTVEIIQLDSNYGFCGGYNRALRQVVADIYVLLNSDIEVTPHWLDALEETLERDSSVAAVQPKILSYIIKNKFEHAGAGGGFMDSLGYPYCRGRIFDHVEDDHGQYDDDCEVFWTSGACMAIRSEVFHEFGGFDEDYFAHMEEIDLCWKLHRKNLKVLYTGRSIIYHVGAGTLAYGNPKKIYLNFRNGVFMVYKHLSVGELFYKLPIRLGLDWVASLKYLLDGEGKNFMAVLRAHLDFFRNLRRETEKRSAIHKKYPSYNRATIKPASIVFDFFVKGKKIFNQ